MDIRNLDNINLTNEQVEDISHGVVTAVIASTMLLKARKHRKRGEWAAAAYYAILWVGFTNNSSQSAIERARKRLTGKK